MPPNASLSPHVKLTGFKHIQKSGYFQRCAFTKPGLRTGKQTNQVYGRFRLFATKISLMSSFTSSFASKIDTLFAKCSFTNHFRVSSFTKSLDKFVSQKFVYHLANK